MTTSLRQIVRSSVLLAVIAIASTRGARAEDWGTPGLDARHTRSSAERSGALFADQRWSVGFPGGARQLASPAVAEGLVVTVDLEGAIHALRATDGALVWTAAGGAPVQGSPAVVHGRLIVPTLGNNVVAMRVADGRPLWTRDLGGMILSSPTPVDDDVVVAAGFPRRSITRLSAATGAVVWESPPVMEQFSNTSPAVADGLVVVGSNGGRVYGFDATTGLLRWGYAGDGIIGLAAPLIFGGRVYVVGGAESNGVHAIDAATGVPVSGWPISLPAPAPDLGGTRIGRQRAVSALIAVDGRLLVETRLDDLLDTNGDGAVDRYLSRESVVAIDPGSGALVWQRELARAEFTEPNELPKYLVCPTPAGFAGVGGAGLVAVASSLAPTVWVLDPATGGELARHVVAGRSLASPVMANGRLFAALESGAVQGLGSSVNHAPNAPVLAANPRPGDAADTMRLRWLPGFDPDGELPSYELRIDTDGEVLIDWQKRTIVGSGTTSLALAPGDLTPGKTYTVAVRARDGSGALSDWSAPETFTVVENPAVTVAGAPVASLNAALEAARAGDVIALGPGRYTLAETLKVGAGVSLQGAGAGRTRLDATGLPLGIILDGSASGLDGVAVSGADRCVQVASGAAGVRLAHLIARDCRVEGIFVQTAGAAEIANATLVGNATALRVAGTVQLKNSLLAGNGVALAVEPPGRLDTSYDDLFDNLTDRTGASRGTGDVALAVTFADLAGRDLRMTTTQASTDLGDPADPVGAEPAPNGGRINLGAFGGTADAETTAVSTTVAGGSPGPSTPSVDSPPPGTSPGPTPTIDEPAPEGGCALAGRTPGGLSLLIVLAMWPLARRRPRRAS